MAFTVWPENPSLAQIKVGESVFRILAGCIPMKLKVSERYENLIVCGTWTFDVLSGAEVDDELEWGPAYGQTGSFIISCPLTQ